MFLMFFNKNIKKHKVFIGLWLHMCDEKSRHPKMAQQEDYTNILSVDLWVFVTTLKLYTESQLCTESKLNQNRN